MYLQYMWRMCMRSSVSCYAWDHLTLPCMQPMPPRVLTEAHSCLQSLHTIQVSFHLLDVRWESRRLMASD